MLLQLLLPLRLPLQLNKASLKAAAALLCLTFTIGGAAFSKSGTTDSRVHSGRHSHEHTSSHITSHKSTHTVRRFSHPGAIISTHSGTHSRVHSMVHSVALESSTSHLRTHSRGHSSTQVVLQETQTIAVVTRDRRGHKHTVFRKVLVPVVAPVAAIHKVSKRVAVLVRDRRGRLHKVYKTEFVEVADVHARGHSTIGHLPANEDNNDQAVVKLKKAHEDGEPKSDGTEPERFNPSYGKAYALYDEGANARIAGNYPLAIANLGRALATIPANSRGGPSVLQLNMEYDLAQSAEAQGDMALAARYYARALADRPNFTDAAVRLATVLAKSGNYGDALRAARSAVQRSPNDPRTHAILSVLLEKSGSSEEAKSEKQKSKALMVNIRSLDTAPLDSPDVVPRVRPQESLESTPEASGKGDMLDDSNK